MAFEQAYIQVVTEQLQEEAEEEAKEATNSDEEVDDANQANSTPLPGQPKQNNPKPNPSPSPKIEETQIENAINLVDNKTMDQKIKKSKLQNNQIDQLQKICGRRLKQFQGKLYEDNVNQITRLDNVNDLNRLFDNINNMKFNEIKTGIEKETDTAKLEKINEAFIGNLLDRNLYNTLITNDALLSEEQKEKLHELHKQQIVALSNKIYDELKNNIRNERIIFRLDDKGYYDSIITETKDALFDTLSEILDFTEDLKELTDKLQITSDIQKLNQSLLTNEHYIDQLDKKRKTRYHNNLSIKKIHQIREVRIATLQKPSKRPLSENSDEENFPTRLSDNAKPVRNANGDINVQISFIVDVYKSGNSLLDILYCSWVIGKDDKFLLTNYTKEKLKMKISLTNPLGFPEEYIDEEENIKQIIIQYQQSLKNQSEISTDNLEKMQNFLINGIKTYNNDDNKKEYLHKIFKILVTRELDDIEEDDDINNVFDSLNFTF
ncbi:hypothetical protein C2G38_2168566 [Gigaspora rosea]|uniref:Uncharacterized protein n=1 Tax=Gigaspora rosea TaxID=44941 RepID=A0A397VPK6_9GLOM|nr:hypothetical protein C2G38_2168566 [Gigaspora rosea]